MTIISKGLITKIMEELPILVNKTVIIGHGISNEIAIKNMITSNKRCC